MIQEIVKDEIFLAQPSAPATLEDRTVAQDLLDTMAAHADGCVGLAANMIGILKRVIVVDDEGIHRVLYNPEIVKRSEPFDAEEGCLSLVGTRKAKRYNCIKVRYQNDEFQVRLKTFKGFTAQIIQHEIDHCNGLII